MAASAPSPLEERAARAHVVDLVSSIAPHDEVESRHQAEVLEWIATGAPLWRTQKPAVPPVHLVAYAALVDPHARSILLCDHRLSGLWLPTGGHVEIAEDPADAAARELGEELGVIAAPLDGDDRPRFVTRTVTVGEDGGHTDVSLWFAFRGNVSEPLRPDPDEFAGVHWWPVGDIREGPDARFDPHLPRFVAMLGGA